MQGKKPSQYDDAARFAFGSFIGIFALLMLAIIGNSIIRGDRLPPNDPRPPGPGYNYWVPKDTISEWHGKEGKSEYGEYEPNER